MRFIVTLLSTLAGFIFTIAGPTKGSAQEVRLSSLSTAVIARQNPSMNSYEMDRKRSLTVLAQQKPGKPPPDTKPSRKTKSPKKYLP
jgi:hypothetical protein